MYKLCGFLQFVSFLAICYSDLAPVKVTDAPIEEEAPLRCYTTTKNDSYSVETCKDGELCCVGMVAFRLAVNQTVPITFGGCFHETGTCSENGCLHSAHQPSNASICLCKGELCNRNITYQAPPLTDPPPPAPTRPPPPPPSKPVWPIVGAVLGCVLLCGAFGLVAYYIHRRYIKIHHPFREWENGEDGEPLVATFPNGKPFGPQYEQEHEIEIIRDIGHGRYGQVQQAKVGENFIAIKKFSPYDRHSFINELMIMREKQEINLLHLLGYIDNPPNNQLWLLTEHMPLGNMSDYLRAHTLTIPQSLHLLSTFISGVCFLHSEPQQVAHRDIKTRNVLMSDHRTAKLADFGLALLLDYGPGGALNEKAAPPTQVGTARYMAPEVLEGSMFYREAEAHMRIDVYASSLVMWEVMWRTQLDQRDVVPPYFLPFERQIPGNPSPCEMQALVAVEKQRPELRAGWANHSVFNKLEITLTESWDNDENARLSSKTIQARIIPLLSNESDSEVSV
ncbi:activin receptor type-2A-like [Bolinopsis microptera]|uniref:activin receptor type-2A-like n=1 Tax=Bolinopsis microptera TaxID=2820187 RepID=UPI003079E4B2